MRLTLQSSAGLFGSYNGSIPKWIVKLFQSDWPVDTLSALAKQSMKTNSNKLTANCGMLKKYLGELRFPPVS